MVTDAFQQMGGTGIMLTETLEKNQGKSLVISNHGTALKWRFAFKS